MFIASATALIAVIFLKERLSTLAWVGMFVGIIEIFLITAGSKGTSFTISKGVIFILSASIVTSFFFVFPKSLLRCYRSNEITTYFTWGELPFFIYFPGLLQGIQGATNEANLSTIYLEVFRRQLLMLHGLRNFHWERRVQLQVCYMLNQLLPLMSPLRVIRFM